MPVPAQDHISLGVPAGDAYSPTGLAVDAGRKLAYVYNTRRGTADPGTGAAISVVNLERRAVSRLIPVPAGYGSDYQTPAALYYGQPALNAGAFPVKTGAGPVV
jgi:hypothetical protein